MMRSLKTEAIVLKKKDLLNRDILISFFTKDLGRLTVFAKGVKKITSRRSPHLQTGNLINVIISHKNDRYYLQESQLISGFSELKKDEDKVKQLNFYLFLIGCFRKIKKKNVLTILLKNSSLTYRIPLERRG